MAPRSIQVLPPRHACTIAGCPDVQLNIKFQANQHANNQGREKKGMVPPQLPYMHLRTTVQIVQNRTKPQIPAADMQRAPATTIVPHHATSRPNKLCYAENRRMLAYSSFSGTFVPTSLPAFANSLDQPVERTSSTGAAQLISHLDSRRARLTSRRRLTAHLT